jgi:histidinol-phosphatase (PHP family)
LIVTCHNPMPDGFAHRYRMRPAEFDDYVALVERARQNWEGDIDVRLGLEADYFEGYEAWLEQQLASADFHYVLGSVHPQLEEFEDRYWRGDPLEFQQTYFEMLAQAAETKLFDCLAHPDLVKNAEVESWDPQAVMESICEALDRIAVTGTAMELNTSGANKSIPEMNPFPDMLIEMRRRDIPVVLGADAHHPARVGDRFPSALELLAECGYEEVQVFRHRQPEPVSIPAAIASLGGVDTAPSPSER